MKAKVVDVRYIPAECDSYIQQKYKRGEYPDSGIAYGDNGTYRVVFSTSADIEVSAYTDSGTRGNFRIGAAVRRICNWCKLTEKRTERIAAIMPSEVDVVTGSDGKLEIAESSLQSWLCGFK